MKKINLRKSNGITLIALVITIIVLLILAGVAIAMLSGQNGILTKAADAKTKTEDAQKEEEKVLKDYEDVINESTGSVKKITFKKQGTGALAVGDEVEASNGEKFYVIGFSGNNANLLAKYNLKADGSSQDSTSAMGSGYACVFSDTDYWTSATDEEKADLNKVLVPEGVTSVITIAKKYGESLGVTGRLMILKEIVALGGDEENKTTSGCPDYINSEIFWLGTGYDVGMGMYGVLSVEGDRKVFSTSNGSGVRPVIEVSKDLIK